MDKVADDVLDVLSASLDGPNYVVSLRFFRAPLVPGTTPAGYVRLALGAPAIISEIRPVAIGTLIAEVKRCLRHRGAQGYGPPLAVLRSRRFKLLVKCLADHLRELNARSGMAYEFALTSGHPFYPVFWDFAFLFVTPQGAQVFVGSSSD